MPIFEIETPEGTFEVEAPDEQTAIEAVAPQGQEDELTKLGREPVSTTEDVVRSGAAGLRQGIEAIPGMFGDIGALGDMAGGWVAKNVFGATDEQIAKGKEKIGGGLMPPMPTTAAIHDATSQVVGESYEPQTVAGEYARTAGQFAPAAITPGGPIRKAANVLAPAVASETAGQMAKGSDYEPLARVAGAVVGGGAVGLTGRPNLTKTAAKGAPPKLTLKDQTNRLYDGLRQAGIRYDANEFEKMANDLPALLTRNNVRPVGRMKEAFDWADEIAKLRGSSPDFDDINSLRSALGEAARGASSNPETKALSRALYILKTEVDNFETGAPLVTNQPVPRHVLDKARKSARELSLRGQKQAALDDIIKDADTYEAGVDSGIRNGIGRLVRSKYGKRLFTDAERNALLEVKNGKKGLRTLSKFGFDFSKLASGATFMPTVGAGAIGSIAAATGLPVAPLVGGVAVAGSIAKHQLPKLTEKALEQAGAAIRSGKLNDPATQQAVRQLRLQRMAPPLLQAGIAGQQPVRNTNQ